MGILGKLSPKPPRIPDEPTLKVYGEGANASLWLHDGIIEKLLATGKEQGLTEEVVSQIILEALNKMDSKTPAIRASVVERLKSLHQITVEGDVVSIRGRVFTVLPDYPSE